ncbi:hypothetical protein, partial [Fibrella forsythiae]
YALAMLLDELLQLGQRYARLPRLIRLGAGSLVLLQLTLLLAMGYEMRLQQELIETHHRKQIGLWLRAHAKAGQTVFMECLGYIGFYSGLKTLDYPGLSSREVISVRRQLPPGPKEYTDEFGPLLERLRPDWVVLRDYEIKRVAQRSSVLQRRYRPVKVFDVGPLVDQHKAMPGYGYLKWDARFTVFYRQDEPSRALTGPELLNRLALGAGLRRAAAVAAEPLDTVTSAARTSQLLLRQ